jgi:hypothetical protein
LQGFPNAKISKSETADMVCAMISSENINEEMLKNDYTVMTWRHCHCCRETKGRRGLGGWEWNNTALRRSLNSSQKQAIITNYFSK